MPSTRSSAATKCISEVPGLAKHTLTPPPTSVRTRLSAPFIASLRSPTRPRASCRGKQQRARRAWESGLLPFVLDDPAGARLPGTGLHDVEVAIGIAPDAVAGAHD